MKEYLRESSEGVFKVAHYDSSRSGDIEIPEGTIKITKDGGGTITFWSSDTVSMNLGNRNWEDSVDGDVMDFDEYCSYDFDVVWERNESQYKTSGSLGLSINKPVKSDGGSSSYYFTTLPEDLIKDIVERGGIEIKDIVRYCFDNDADCKDIIKALKRIRENLKGAGKEGVDCIYDANKICFFAEELRSSLKVPINK